MNVPRDPDNIIQCYIIQYLLFTFYYSTLLIRYTPPELHACYIFRRVEVQLAQVTLLHVEQDVLVDSECRSFPLQFEDNHTTIVA